MDATDASMTVSSVTDGDTLRIMRRWVHVDPGNEVEPGLLMDEIREFYDNPEVYPKGRPARLVHLDTPEMTSKDPAERTAARKARTELTAWLTARQGRLRCVFSEEPGAFGRFLVDIYTEGDRNDTASQWMLLHGNDGAGWPPYIKGA